MNGRALPVDLDEFLREVGQMAADAVLAKYRQEQGLASTTMESPRGIPSTETPDPTEESVLPFVPRSSGIRTRRRRVRHGR